MQHYVGFVMLLDYILLLRKIFEVFRYSVPRGVVGAYLCWINYFLGGIFTQWSKVLQGAWLG